TASSDIESETSIKYKRSEENNQPVNIEFTNANNYKSEANESNPIKIDQEEHKKTQVTEKFCTQSKKRSSN
ncbi:12684_t:CDS:1, partial [Dentiscutata erythropus]